MLKKLRQTVPTDVQVAIFRLASITILIQTADSSDDNPKYAVSHLETAVSLPANHMKRGKFYTYTFTISLKEIKVSAAKVNDWGSVTGNFDVN